MQDSERVSALDEASGTAPENAPQPEAQAAQSEEAKSTPTEKVVGTADAAAPRSGAGAGAGSKGNANARAKSQNRRRSSNSGPSTKSDSASSDLPPSLQEQLLTPLTVPPATLDRRLLPANLLDALDAAGLGAAETLPAATLMVLATVTAVVGPGVRCEAGGELRKLIGNTCDTAVRVALIASDRRAPLVPSAILAGAYAAENVLVDRYEEACELDAEHRRDAAERRRLHAQATAIAATLGTPLPPPLIEAARSKSGARPCIVVRDGAAAAIRAAAAGGSGLLLIDERRMASMTRVADFYDGPTEMLLSALARGDHLPIFDPKSRRTIMRSLPASVIGVLTTADCGLLHKVTPASYTATAFVPAVPAPTGDSAGLVALLRGVGAIAADPVILQMPESALTGPAETWAALAAGMLPPVSDYLACLPDLARRLAIGLHLAAAAGDGKLSPAIPPATVRHAIAIVNSCVMPTALAVLSPVSTADNIRDARRIIGHLRVKTSSQKPRFERRPLLRSWQDSMPTSQFDAAIALLEDEKLLTAIEKSGSREYDVAVKVYTA